jgi:adenylate cyclase, class 2
MAMAAQGKEIEIKLRVADIAAMRRKLAHLGAHVLRRDVAGKDGRVHEMNTLYDTPDRGLGRNQELLRIRVETPAKPPATAKSRAVMTFKRPPEESRPVSEAGDDHGLHRILDEAETVIDDHEAIARVFHAMGLHPWFRYEKFRTTYELGPKARWARDLLIELDETPIGVFIELEGPIKAIDRAAQTLGYKPADFITKNYLTLHAEQLASRGREPSQVAFGVYGEIPDVMFPSRKKSR